MTRPDPVRSPFGGDAPATAPRLGPAWLENAVFYEIYPQTFADSNADGIGDLEGIIARLPYLHELGIDAIWLNPCFESPFRDAGYDISDFYKVAPRYGSNDHLRRLFDEAGKLGIKVMLDLVAGHTSDQHPWFQQSQRHARNAYSDWFVWTDSVWTRPKELNRPVEVGAAERDGNYVVNFFSFQPALNYGFAKPDPAQPWQQPVDAPGPQATRAELKKIMKFWFDLGAAGFRVDMAGSLVKNDPDGSATAALWQDFRGWMDREYPDRAMVSEWSKPDVAIPAGFHMDFLLDWGVLGYKRLFRPDGAMAPVFDRSGSTGFRAFLDDFEPLYAATRGKGFIAIPSGNHDTVPRLGDGRDARDLAVAHAFLLTMPGVPFLYYGDEIGMRSIAGLPSKEGGFNRTASRTPMQWDNSVNAGFSRAPAEQLYLPLDTATDRPTVAAQRGQVASPLETVRALIALRRAHPALGASGDYRTLSAEPGQPLVFERIKDGERILVAINPTGEAAEARLPGSLALAGAQHLAGCDDTLSRDGDGWRVRLPAVAYAVLIAAT